MQIGTQIICLNISPPLRSQRDWNIVHKKTQTPPATYTHIKKKKKHHNQQKKTTKSFDVCRKKEEITVIGAL